MRLEKIIFTRQAIGKFFSNVQSFTIATERNRSTQANPQQADCCGEGVTKEKREKFQNLRDGLRLSMTSGSQGIHFAAQHYQVRHASCF